MMFSELQLMLHILYFSHLEGGLLNRVVFALFCNWQNTL